MCFLKKIFTGNKPDYNVLVPSDNMPLLHKKFYVGVGINAYPSNGLNGCVNDIEDMFELLTKYYGFERGDNMRLLCDSRATKAAIWERLLWLVGICKEGDLCLFNYSGHGASLPNRTSHGEIDGVDECLVPYDFDWSAPHMLLDDDLGMIADKIAAKGAIPIFIIDACHSGTILRDMNFNPAFKMKNKCIVPPIDIRARITDNIRNRTVVDSLADNENSILIAGCKEKQTSADAYFNGKYNGALTYNLVKALKSNHSLTYAQLETVLATEMEQGGFEQTPLIIGPKNLIDKKVFDF